MNEKDCVRTSGSRLVDLRWIVKSESNYVPCCPCRHSQPALHLLGQQEMDVSNELRKDFRQWCDSFANEKNHE